MDENKVVFTWCCFQVNIIASGFGFPYIMSTTHDHGYGRGVTPVFIGVFEPLARVTLYLTNEMVLAVVLEQLRLPLHGGLVSSI